MSKKPTVRLATEDDMEACLALDHSYESNQVWQMDYHRTGISHQTKFQAVRLPRMVTVQSFYEKKQIQRYWQTADCVLIAEDEEQIIGYACLNVDRIDRMAWLDLVVAPAARRHKCGSTLLDATAKWGRHNQLKRLMVRLQTKNGPALNFYQNKGFVFCGYNEQLHQSGDIMLFLTAKL